MTNTQGSPPRMRGKGAITDETIGIVRITPACAGKSCPPQAPTFTRQDHPRVCGEKAAYFRAEWVPKGSPPRMRGKGRHPGSNHPRPGITPAYAGKSRLRRHREHTLQDHPRVCGEKGFWTSIPSGLVGSPPRMRGKGAITDETIGIVRITPAYAGKRVTDQNYEDGR